MSGFTSNLLLGLAVYLQGAGLGTWSASGAYSSGQTGIRLGDMPPEPDRLIVLTAYPVSDDPSLSDSEIGVQIRTRWSAGDKQSVDDLSDALFDLLHGKRALLLSTGVTIGQCYRQSASPLGQDALLRWENVSNYYASVWLPSTNRT